MSNTVEVDAISAAEFDELAMRMGLERRPGTLFSEYVLADASRDAELLATFVRVGRGDSFWWHGFHRRRIEGTSWWDASSPYGYGGPLTNCTDDDFLKLAWASYCEWMRAHHFIVEYVRFHPVIANERIYGGHVDANRQVVWMDLKQTDIQSSYLPRLRGTVSKAAKIGLCYREYPLSSGVAEFGTFYRRAMAEMGTDSFFHFDDTYFSGLALHPGARLGVCTGPESHDWLAACVLLDGIGVTEYHLAATCAAGRRAGAPTHALHSAALAAQCRGQVVFYLGGGSSTGADNPLLFFKAGFSPLRLTYHTGSNVFDKDAYEALKQQYPDAWAAYPQRPIFYRKV